MLGVGCVDVWELHISSKFGTCSWEMMSRRFASISFLDGSSEPFWSILWRSKIVTMRN